MVRGGGKETITSSSGSSNADSVIPSSSSGIFKEIESHALFYLLIFKVN